MQSNELKTLNFLKSAFAELENLDNPFAIGTDDYNQYSDTQDELLDALDTVRNNVMNFLHLSTGKAVEQGICDSTLQYEYEKDLI